MSGRRVYKVQLQTSEGVCTRQLPEGARVISVGAQDGKLVAWALVEPGAEPEGRDFYVSFTGCEGPRSFLRESRFVGTIQIGRYVYHVFSDRPRKAT